MISDRPEEEYAAYSERINHSRHRLWLVRIIKREAVQALVEFKDGTRRYVNQSSLYQI